MLPAWILAFRVRAWEIDVGAAGARWVETLLAHPATREWDAAALAETFGLPLELGRTADRWTARAVWDGTAERRGALGG